MLIGNPTDEVAEVDVTFFFDSGDTLVEHRRVRANSRVNVWVNAEVARANRRAFSILVESRNAVGVVAERAMYWGNLREGHVVAGIREESTTWAFAEGIEGEHRGLEYDSYFLLANTSEVAAEVRATFLLEDGTGVETTFSVRPTSRYTLPTGMLPELVGRRFSAFFHSNNGTPILAERAVYWGHHYQGGHASAGIPWHGVVAAPETLVTATLP